MGDIINQIITLYESSNTFVYLLIVLILRLMLVLNRRYDLGNKILRFVQKVPNWATVFKNTINKGLILILLIIVQVTLTIRFITASIGKFLINRTFWGLTFLFGFIILLYWVSGFVSFKYILLFFYLFNPLSPDDQLVLKIITNITNVIGISLPISITLYVFAFREQKASSVSGIYSRNLSLIIFVLISVIMIPYGKFLVHSMVPDVADGQFNSTYLHSGRITTWLILAAIAVVFGARMLKETIRSVNIRWLLHDINMEINDSIFKMLFAWTKKQRVTLYPTCHMYIESLYQLFTIASEKNMNEVYDDNYKKWTGILAKLFQSPRLDFVDSTTRYEYLLSKEKSGFQSLYKSILRNHISLILSLSKNNKVEEAHNAIKTFFELVPRSEELYSIYLTSLHELSVLLADDNVIGIHPILNEIEQISSNSDFKNGLVFIYKALLIRAVQKNDVKAISSFAYSLSKCIEKEEFSLTKESVDQAIDKLKNSLGQKITSNNFTQTSSIVRNSTLENAGIFVLLQAALKSIELAHYSSTGFLIKFMVTNYDPNIFNFTFKRFCKHKGANNPFISQRQEYSKINVSFNFNDKTLEYCTKKLVILVYGQQMYVKEKNIDFGYVPNTFIEESLASCSYLDHLLDNIKKVGDKYGFNFTIDDKLTEGLKKNEIQTSPK
ncbi:hypothetical protein ACAF76_008530 [Brevibacillus sp. TJ4]|uniref:hypothetical protein n=1 Tax=Brevibacillus sp. TJ4 TaxID=3234853 RepID=UPI0037D886DB